MTEMVVINKQCAETSRVITSFHDDRSPRIMAIAQTPSLLYMHV